MLELSKLTPEFVERVLGYDAIDNTSADALADESRELMESVGSTKAFRSVCFAFNDSLKDALNDGSGIKLANAIVTSQIIAIQLGMKLQDAWRDTQQLEDLHQR